LTFAPPSTLPIYQDLLKLFFIEIYFYLLRLKLQFKKVGTMFFEVHFGNPKWAMATAAKMIQMESNDWRS